MMNCVKNGRALRAAWLLGGSLTLSNGHAELNSSFLTLPVLRVSMEQDSTYGFLAKSNYENLLSNQDAMAFLLDFGEDQFRIGLNWGHFLSEHQRLKLGVEHFAQGNTFDFPIAADHDVIGQNALGGTYEYLFNQSWPQSIAFSAYAANAADYDAGALPDNYGYNLLNIREVAGGESVGSSIGFSWSLGSNTRLQTAINYDQVHFSPQFEPAPNEQGLGATLNIESALSSQWQTHMLATYRQPYRLVQGGIDWMIIHKPEHQLQLGLLLGYLESDILPVKHETMVGLQLTSRWGTAMQVPTADTLTDLINWTQETPAHMPAVFVMRDQLLIANS